MNGSSINYDTVSKSSGKFRSDSPNAALENMILGIGKYKNRDVCLVECKEITERLASMIKEVLDTSGLDFTQDKQKAEDFDLSAILPDLCEPYQLIAKAKQICFHLEIQEDCPVHLSKRSLEKLLSNVLSNAVSYTMPEHCISVVLCASRITIENECTPIKAEDVPRLFEPFYRPDFARDRKFGGNGLGLYIVDTLADALELRYTFAPKDSPQGMKFTLFFHILLHCWEKIYFDTIATLSLKDARMGRKESAIMAGTALEVAAICPLLFTPIAAPKSRDIKIPAHIACTNPTRSAPWKSPGIPKNSAPREQIIST